MVFGKNSPLAPWHMWGTSVLVHSENRGAQSQQLTRISYGRPETWSFFVAAEIVRLDNPTPANPVSVRVDFELLSGVGRDVLPINGRQALGVGGITVTPWVRMQWDAIPSGTAVSAIPDALRWTTQTRSPQLQDGDATSVFPFQWFPAQDIQCSAVVSQSSNIPATVDVRVTSFFAPRTHVRPEWFLEKFSNELGGA